MKSFLSRLIHKFGKKMKGLNKNKNHGNLFEKKRKNDETNTLIIWAYK